jgi:CRP-like cAMP-binding protein
MATVSEFPQLGRKKGFGRGEMARLAADVVQMARYLAADQRVTVGEIISGLVREPLLREYNEFRKRMAPSWKAPVPVVKAEPVDAKADRDAEIGRLASKGMSQKAIAEQVGLTQATVSRILKQLKEEKGR